MTNPRPYPGYLIAIEGIDGAGKTTQAHFVQERLQARGLTVIRTKEPTTGHWGQILRDSALTGRLSTQEEVRAFIMDRTEHVTRVINPSLQAGHIVIVDRYYFSTVAYQGARGLNPAELMAANEVFAPEPDLLVILDIDPAIGLQRIRTRGDRANHFEQTNTLTRAREIFLSVRKPYLYLLDATLPPHHLRDQIVARFSQIATEAIAASTAPLAQKLDSTLALFGASPLS